MFTRAGGTPRQRRLPASARKEEARNFDSPLDELISALNRLEAFVEKIRCSSEDERNKPPTTPRRDLGLAAAFRSRRGLLLEKKKEDEPTPPPSPRRVTVRNEPTAKFLSMDAFEEEEVIELVRRIAELVIRGEKAAASMLEKEDQRRKQRNGDSDDNDEEQEDDVDSHIALFEQFFERNAMALIVNIVTGAAFKTETDAPAGDELEKDEDRDKESEDGKSETIADTVTENKIAGAVTENKIADEVTENKTADAVTENKCLWLPSLSIATQVVQSVSILIQNVSRATSLYFLLSNNHINELIALPMESYAIADRCKRGESAYPPTPRRSASPELAELTTHFISFLKSLAMRMNAETLQFFLAYPAERADEDNGSEAASAAHFSEASPQAPQIKVLIDSEGDGPMDETELTQTCQEFLKPIPVETIEVEFPLYARALEFCSAQQDSFVRVTAMNVCLNTLRLATVSPATDSNDVHDNGASSPQRASPDGVLHNAQPLPLRERLAIAQHVCCPSRVEGLVSPIFTKLAQLWGMLEEHFRDLELLLDGRQSNARGGGILNDLRKRSRNLKVEKAKEEARRAKLNESFNEAVANLHDELLLLEDVFKVGLTSLNEQIIEMMLATFVYPLLMQPLLLYIQRLPTPNNSEFVAFGEGLDSLSNDNNLVDRNMELESASVKTAFFALASVFHVVTNRPLLRLMLTALFHPLAPDSSGVTMIRSRPDVACTGPQGGLDVRVDIQIENFAARTLDEKLTYSFGKVTGRRSTKHNMMDDSSHSRGTQESCVFVLSPALAEVLEGKAGDESLITNTRLNPYRQAILRCLAGGPSMLHIRQLSILLIDSAVGKFDGNFLSDLMFGSELEASDDEALAGQSSDMQISPDRNTTGGGGKLESRRLFARTSSNTDSVSPYMIDVVTSLCLSVMNAASGHNGVIKLHFDDIAAHALLCIVQGNVQAIQSAAKLIDRRKRQASAFIVTLPSGMEVVDVESIGKIENGITTVSAESSEVRLGLAMDRIIHDAVRSDHCAVIDELLQFKETVTERSEDYSLPIALECSLHDFSVRASSFTNDSADAYDTNTNPNAVLMNAANTALSFMKLDAFSTLIQGLAATDGKAIENRQLSGLAFSGTGIIVDTSSFLEGSVNRSVFAPISKELCSALFDRDGDTSRGDKVQLQSGAVVGLVGRTAFPCVCEVPAVSASLFTDDAASVVAEGVKWQSLYLVFFGRYMILAEPEKGGSGGDGRVVTLCKLAQLRVERDPVPPTSSSSAARRLLLSFRGFEPTPPGLFLLDQSPTEETYGPFVRLRTVRSCLDVWFEDDNAAEQALKVMASKIMKARAKRGNRLREKLSPDEQRLQYAAF